MENSTPTSWPLNPPSEWACQITIDYPAGKTTPADVLALSGKVPACDGVAFGTDSFTIGLTVMAESATVALMRAARTITESLDTDAMAVSAISTKRTEVLASLA